MFSESLDIILLLTFGKEQIIIPGSHVGGFRLFLRPWGFSGELDFSVHSRQEEDEVLPLFTDPAVIALDLTVGHHLRTENTSPFFIRLKGLVTEKEIRSEQAAESHTLKKDPVLSRNYRIAFADPLFVLWRRHFPSELVTGKSLRELIESHTPAGLTVKYDWEEIEKKTTMTALSMGQYMAASFYDFIAWQVDERGGFFTYDYEKNGYLFSAEKPVWENPVSIRKRDVEGCRITFAEPLRHNLTLMNVGAENPETKEIKQDDAAMGIRVERPARYPVPSRLADREKKEKGRLVSPGHNVSIAHASLPEYAFFPWVAANPAENQWTKGSYLYKKKYRVANVELSARCMDPEAVIEAGTPFARFSMSMDSILETKEEKVRRLPSFTPPEYPLVCEGLIVSETGDEKSETYQIYTDDDTSLEGYRVKIPAWENQVVDAPFEPDLITGHFYFPLYRDARVLVALGLHTAKITRVLEWRKGVKLPLETQGNSILMGKTDKSRTEIRHIYVDDKPVLNVKRISDEETGEILMKEGNLSIELK